MEPASRMETDVILRNLGPYGRWQILQLCMVGIMIKFFTSMGFVSIVFIGWIPPHHCRIPENATLNETVPGKYVDGGFVPDKCLMYDPADMNSTIPCTDGWTFEEDRWTTIASEWNLVCDRDFMSDFAQTLTATGLLLGSVFFTTVADIYGRKRTMLTLNLLYSGLGIGLALTQDVYTFLGLRVISGAIQMGAALSCYTFTTELFASGQRSFAVNILFMFANVGQCSLALFGYFIRNWRYFQLVTVIPNIITLAGYWLMNETIPWLLANKRGREAADVLKRAARFNKRNVPEDLLEKMAAQTVDGKRKSAKEHLKTAVSKFCSCRQEGEVRIRDVFRHPKLRLYTILVMIIWFCTVFIYYGLTLSTSSFVGDRFINFFLSAIVEIPAYVGCIYVLKRFGRRYPIVVMYVLTGISLFITGFIPHKTDSGLDLTGVIIALNTFGKFGISSAFSGIYLYTGELYPTNTRSRGLGIASASSRVGAMLSPFSAYLGRHESWLVGVVFGILSALTALLFIPLPETGGKSMPQTLEDVGNISKKNKTMRDVLEMATEENANESCAPMVEGKPDA